MIRFIVGLFLIMGSVDVEHYQTENIISVSIGLFLIIWAGHSFRQQDHQMLQRNIKGTKIRRRF